MTAMESWTDAEVVANYDQLAAAYEEALTAYQSVMTHGESSADEATTDALEAEYLRTRDELVAARQYWRGVGEATGTRTFVTTTDNEGV